MKTDEEKLLEKASAKTSVDIEKEVIERLAAIEHEQWIKWSQDIAAKETLSPTRLSRWKNLWIPYAELSEDMKEYDRKWARETLKILNNGYSIIYQTALELGKRLGRESEREKLQEILSLNHVPCDDEQCICQSEKFNEYWKNGTIEMRNNQTKELKRSIEIEREKVAKEIFDNFEDMEVLFDGYDFIISKEKYLRFKEKYLGKKVEE